MEYNVNKGIGKSVEFKGLKSQYLFIFAGEVIKAKAVELFHSEGIKPKEVRRTMRLRHKPACASA